MSVSLSIFFCIHYPTSLFLCGIHKVSKAEVGFVANRNRWGNVCRPPRTKRSDAVARVDGEETCETYERRSAEDGGGLGLDLCIAEYIIDSKLSPTYKRHSNKSGSDLLLVDICNESFALNLEKSPVGFRKCFRLYQLFLQTKVKFSWAIAIEPYCVYNQKISNTPIRFFASQYDPIQSLTPPNETETKVSFIVFLAFVH